MRYSRGGRGQLHMSVVSFAGEADDARSGAPVFNRAVSALAAWLDVEQGRWVLWVPVLFATGIGLYFALPSEPSQRLAFGALTVAFAMRVIARDRLIGFLVTSAALCIAAGFTVATIRTAVMDAPIIDRRGAYDIEGFVESFDRQAPKRSRAVIRVASLKIDGADAPKKPFRARISIRGDQKFRPGSTIKLRALLQPPPEPVMPYGFDFARMSYFQGVGASGFSLSKPEEIEAQTLPFDMRPRAWLARVRGQIGERIIAAIPGQTGEIAAALTVGQTAGLDETVMDDLRKSGLAHVISISGLHMSLVAGAVFWFMRWVLALFPWLALRYPVRTLAGASALFCVTVYLALSGAAVGAVRSYIMIAIIFLAILLNRPALSLRNVAFAGFVILVVLPDSLVDVSFQMSFAATAALIAGYERFGRYLHFEARNVRHRLLWQPIYFVGAVLITTATAGLAVEPFSAYHFHNLTTYAALGNLLGGPPVDFITMPAMIVALIAMPFGLEDWPLQAMAFGIDLMMLVAKFVASLPNALVNVAAFPFAALLLIVLGGCWLIIWRTRWRLLGLTLIGAGVALTSVHDKPDILIEREAKVIAIRAKDGLLQAPKARKPSYSLAQWLKADGDRRDGKEAVKGTGFRCDTASCITIVKGRLVSLVKKPDAFFDDCRRASIMVAPMDIRMPCAMPQVILDRGALWEKGSAAIYLKKDGIRVVRSSDARGDRPWSPERHRREPIPPTLLEADRPLPEDLPELEKME